MKVNEGQWVMFGSGQKWHHVSSLAGGEPPHFFIGCMNTSYPMSILRQVDARVHHSEPPKSTRCKSCIRYDNR